MSHTITIFCANFPLFSPRQKHCSTTKSHRKSTVVVAISIVAFIVVVFLAQILPQEHNVPYYSQSQLINHNISYAELLEAQHQMNDKPSS
ncbi:hypothetical protein P8452_02581 [Trifolium repens]|nr:hypothetical protein P8452_02581 [Trifolium repens]